MRIFKLLLLVLLPIFAVSAVATAQEADEWATPFDQPTQLVNEYRQPNSDYAAGHRGVDYLVSLNQPILAPADGEIRFVGLVVDRWLLTISHPNGQISEFEPACTDLSQGDRVTRGQPIAWVCEALPNYRQHCDQMRCLHFSLRQSGLYLSPLALIGGLNPSRLLPLVD